VRWSDDTVSVDMTRESIQSAPAFDSAAALNLENEARLYAHYGRSRD
jgi:hypothetical protein